MSVFDGCGCPVSAGPVEEFEVEDLDAAGVLEAAAEAERAERRASLMKLRLAYQWAVLHPATRETGVETPGGQAAFDVLTREESLGGEGTPAVAAFPRGVRPRAGHLPRPGSTADRRRPGPAPPAAAAVETGGRLAVPAWQARRVAQQTHRLPLAVPAGSTTSSRPAPTAPSAR